MKELCLKISGIVLIAAFVVAFIYGCYWLAKTTSYNLFYKDMVKSTITEMVKPEALKE